MRLTLFPKTTLIASSLLVNLFSINTIWSPTQGWYREWAYYSSSLTPYKDFYLPFPPLFVWINQLFLLFPDPILTERIFMVLIWTLLSLGLYLMIEKLIANKKAALLGTLLSVYAFQFSPTNTIAGYYEFALMLLFWGVYCCLLEKPYLNLLGGVGIAAASLTKQNFVVGLPVFIFCICAIWVFEKKFLKKILIASIGILLTYLVFGIYLLLTDSFSAFVKIMLEGGGKSPHLTALIYSLLAPITEPRAVITLLFGFALIFVVSLKVSLSRSQILSAYLLAMIFLWFLVPSSINNQAWGRLGLIIGLSIFLTNYYLAGTEPFLVGDEIFLWLLLVTPAGTFVAAEVLMRIWPVQNHRIAATGKIADGFASYFVSVFLTLAFTGCILFVLKNFTKAKTPNQLLSGYPFQSNLTDKLSTLVLLIFLLFAGVLNAFNGGFDFPSNLGLGAFGIAVLIDQFGEQVFKLRFLWVFAISFVIASMSITLHIYSWFGWNENFSAHSSNQIPIFRNMHLTGYETDYYTRISIAVDNANHALPKSNGKNPRLFVFPMEPIIYDLSKIEQYRVNCPILHFDICPERVATLDLKRIMQDPPEIVVLFDLGKDFIRSNEATFRGGKNSAYQSILKYFVKSRDYTLVDSLLPDGTNLATTSILVRQPQKSISEDKIIK